MGKKDIIILSGFILLKFLLHYFLIAPEYDLQRDEYLHLDQANHLAFGFASVPPLISWISFLIKLLGNSIFWIKFFPVLSGALTIVVVWATISELKGNLYAKILGATCILFSVLLRLNTLYQPNSFDVLCWTTTFFFLIKYINTDHSKWIYYTAIVFALGFLNKYNIIFLALGIAPALMITKSRRLFLRKEIYLAIVLALLIVSPNLIWQYQNGFPVFHHLNALADSQLVHVPRTLFLKNQLLFFTGSIVVITSALYGLLFSGYFKKFRFLFWAFLFILTLFTYLKAKDYYAIGLYPVYIAIGSVYVFRIPDHTFGKMIKPILFIVPVLVFILSFNVAFPNKTPEYIISNQDTYKALGLLRWEDGKDHEIPQDYADMLGWKELATKVDKAYLILNDPERTLVLCDNYGQAGAINFYSENGIKAVSFDADYVNWFDLQKDYTHLIRVKNGWEREHELMETSPYFEHSIISDSVTNKYAREFGTTIFIFQGSKVDINKRIEAELNRIKNHN
ncbi:glycosyl transferase [Sinomicrobium pectinilyticum]|uniref:Glycosyl transferase n=1 Tax=Sinomicrobium pectinilyticum TaxID=1084421 RepID=A0A3N0CX61_SINP1|nr:glycosyltransferase family 39 protein [Sinomicrobium pectinilyticum]RNL68040.1 glycosyl transferase [Sinomicrobium pectinilyticum]